jgi:hypothetical protein
MLPNPRSSRLGSVRNNNRRNPANRLDPGRRRNPARWRCRFPNYHAGAAVHRHGAEHRDALRHHAHDLDECRAREFHERHVGRVQRAFIHKKANKIEASGFCNYADVDGGQVFEHFVIPLQSQDNPLQANSVWTGGTGKYEGLQGAFPLSSIILPTTDENTSRSSGGRRDGTR